MVAEMVAVRMAKKHFPEAEGWDAHGLAASHELTREELLDALNATSEDSFGDDLNTIADDPDSVS
jgi:hypothetical protein